MPGTLNTHVPDSLCQCEEAPRQELLNESVGEGNNL